MPDAGPLSSPLDARMKRTTASEMFRLTDAYLRATRPPASAAPTPFAVLPRFGACIRLNPGAVGFFFANLHGRPSWRSRALQAALEVLALWPHQLSARVPGLTVFDPSACYPSTDWAGIDVLLAEWQFVGVFSGAKGTVSHVLTEPKYARCFRNEVEGRAAMRPFVPLPETLHVEREGTRGWTEAFSPNTASPNARRAAFDELQRAMCRAYAEVDETVPTATYLAELRVRAADRYAGGNADVLGRLGRLTAWAEDQAVREGADAIRVARGHGDFNLGQVLAAEDAHVLIDWSESERAVVFHDYVQAALWSYGWRDVGVPIDVPDLAPMRGELAPDLDALSPLLAVALVLAEIGVKQHVDYNEARGTVRSWTALADRALDLIGDQTATLRPSRDDLPAQS